MDPTIFGLDRATVILVPTVALIATGINWTLRAAIGRARYPPAANLGVPFLCALVLALGFRPVVREALREPLRYHPLPWDVTGPPTFDASKLHASWCAEEPGYPFEWCETPHADH